jgi:hypothetical protein
MAPQELKELLEVLKAYGVQQAKIGDIEVVFAPDFEALSKAQHQADEDLQFAHSN